MSLTVLLTLLLLLLAAVALALALAVLARGRAARELTARLDGVDRALGPLDWLHKGQDRLGLELRQDLAGARQEHTAHTVALRDELARALDGTRRGLEELRVTIDERLRLGQEDNARRLELMRQTVDEKLQATLETRLGESFRLVSERLAEVQRGLGEMQSLARGVRDLERVLGNVKTRGTFGEVQLASLLEQFLVRDQYDVNVATRGGSERVEFAIKLPARDPDGPAHVWLPIDAKFPLEDYQRLVDAAERADAEAVADAADALELRVRGCAKTICDKYIEPPATTDFAIMFVPTEGLFAEILRRPGVFERLRRDHRVIVAGPTTLAALLGSLEVGFRSLAIERRSSEVWRLLATVKTEFGKFGELLEKVQKKLGEASNTIELAAKKSRTIEKRLGGIESLPAVDARVALDAGDVGDMAEASASVPEPHAE